VPFAGIDTDAGTVRLLELELSVTVAPVAVAADNPAIQVVELAGETVVGAQVMLTSVLTAAPLRVMPPLVPVTLRGSPATEEPMTLLTVTVDVVAAEESVTETFATTPLATIPAPPLKRQVYFATLPVQLILLPAACTAASGTTLNFVILAVGPPSVHCSAVGAVPDATSDKSIETVLPGAVATDDKVRKDCATNGVVSRNNDARRRVHEDLNVFINIHTPRNSPSLSAGKEQIISV
jgi:hypothetical protein